MYHSSLQIDTLLLTDHPDQETQNIISLTKEPPGHTSHSHIPPNVVTFFTYEKLIMHQNLCRHSQTALLYVCLSGIIRFVRLVYAVVYICRLFIVLFEKYPVCVNVLTLLT